MAKSLLGDLYITLKYVLVLYIDNISIQALSNNLVFYVRSKHIQVNHHFLGDQVIRGIFDCRTKALVVASFLFLRPKLMF